MEEESFEIAPMLPAKRKRSSILKPAEKRTSRDSRTVSFNERCVYRELYVDGTHDVTNLFIGEDMDLTMMEVVEPDYQNVTINSCVDMSMDGTNYATQDMQDIDVSTIADDDGEGGEGGDDGKTVDVGTCTDNNANQQINQSVNDTSLNNRSISMEKSSLDRSMSKCIEKSMDRSFDKSIGVTQLSDISSIDANNPSFHLTEELFGAFQETLNNMSTATSAIESMMNNVEALNDCVNRIEQDVERSRQMLDEEIENLFRFYRHVVSKENKYEFAIAIFGLRHSLWLIFKIEPETYPNEVLRIRFAVNKRDRHLYPFPEYAHAVRRYTEQGSRNYLTKFVINAQKFRRFIRRIGYGKTVK